MTKEYSAVTNSIEVHPLTQVCIISRLISILIVFALFSVPLDCENLVQLKQIDVEETPEA
jgi:hypothetical protein